MKCSPKTEDLYVGSFTGVVFNACAGSLIAFCLVKLTIQMGGSILTFVQHLFY
jgi:hypothetical protein